MEDKVFELLTKMYTEFDARFNKMDARFDKMDSRFVKLEMVIENEIRPGIKTALEGYRIIYEKQQEHTELLERLNEKIEKQDVEIRVIKAVK